MGKGLPLLLMALFVVTGCVSKPMRQEIADVRLQLGMHYLARQDYPAAERNLLRAERATPRDYRVALALARLFQAQNNNSATMRYYKRAQALAPGNGYVANNYGAFLCALGQYDEAHQQFNQAAKAREPEADSDALELSGYCYLQSGSLAAARQQLLAALATDEDKGPSLLQEAERRLERRELATTRLLLEVYQHRLPATAESLWLEIRFAAQQGNAADVTRYGDRLARSFPQSIQYQRYLANEY
ncbi:type IV pilus biogenesis/stability protein PilW [Pantoea sp.]|uniref:type IV pilus biogenesis/stability protein PilW n=1 Tax=Pantoea sp. TaxID=69393 RepID=UPI0028A18086|nr:type IV pilus biogenesis/stability protein PilW [Pantoea sp.]